MSLNKDVNFSGFERALNEAKKLPEKVRKKVLQKASMAVAREIRKEARKNAPVKSGILKSNIVALQSRSKDKNVVRSAVLVRRHKNLTKKFKNLLAKGVKIRTSKDQTKTDGYYAYFVEHGTKHIKARSFLENAIKKVEPNMQKIAQDYIDEFLESEKW